MQGGTPEAGGTQRSWVQAYFLYAAASAEAGHTHRDDGYPAEAAFFSSLLGLRG